jgi:CRISPR-associated protein Cas2
MIYLIGYDIADKKRLTKVAKLLERHAVRLQYSLFVYDTMSENALEALIDAILALIDTQHDDVRVYTLRNDERIVMGIDKWDEVLGIVA